MIVKNDNAYTELLSPAGSMQALYAAVQNGADAVYLGSKEFSARSSAANFNNEEIKIAVEYCKIRGVEVYLALNTLINQNEISSMEKIIEYACEIGISAIIVQDMGVYKIVKSIAPNMPIHGSTQMTVHSIEGAQILKNLGFSRVVLARELCREDIEYITKNLDIETEVFVHGALCVCYSGKCLMSSMIGGRSGNRGSCAQPCRLPYTFSDKKGYFLSPKDLSLIDFINELKKVGVKSFKIEGRMKSPEYVATVTGVYRKAIDEGKVSKEDKQKLQDIFCRGEGFTAGYFTGDIGKSMLNPHLSNDKTGRNAPPALLKEASQTFKEGAENKKVNISVDFKMQENKPCLTLSRNNVNVTLCENTSDTPPVSKDRIAQQLSKLGSTPFVADNINIEMDELKVKISELNNLRREGVEALVGKILENRKIDTYDINLDFKGGIVQKPFEFTAFVSNIKQAEAVIFEGVKRVYIPSHLCDKISGLNADIFVSLPAIIKKNDRENVLRDTKNALKQGAKGVLCESLEGIALGAEIKTTLLGGFGLNITNRLSLEVYKSLGLSSATASTEISIGKILELSDLMLLEAVIYGRLPLMITENCLISASGGKCSCKGELIDRTNTKFPILKDGKSCRNIILNSRPIYLGDRLSGLNKISYGQMYFTIEDPEECRNIIKMYKQGEKFSNEFTRGYLV